MNRFVLDCSMTMAWCFEDESTPYSESVLEALADGEAVVPAIWTLEVANVLAVGERKRRLLPAQSLRFIELLQNLPITTDPAVGSIGELLGLAREQKLSSYDASYLDLAVRTGLPLASLDERLMEAADRFGVVWFEAKA